MFDELEREAWDLAAYRVIITPGAKSDLRAICRYIRRHAPQAAKVWLKGVHQSIKSLKQYPERAALAPESFAFHEPVRELIYGQGNRGTYRILFVIHHALIHVLHVRHGSRLPLGQNSEEDE